MPYIYFWADGIHVQVRPEDAAQCLPVTIGATPEGKKELFGPIGGVRENAQSRRKVSSTSNGAGSRSLTTLRDLLQHGLDHCLSVTRIVNESKRCNLARKYLATISA